MTREGRQNLIFVACVASLAAHVGLMFWVGRQVIMRPARFARSATRISFAATEKAARPETLEWASLKDTAASQAAPEASTAEGLPLYLPVAPAPAFEVAPSAPVVEMPAPPDAPKAVAFQAEALTAEASERTRPDYVATDAPREVVSPPRGPSFKLVELPYSLAFESFSVSDSPVRATVPQATLARQAPETSFVPETKMRTDVEWPRVEAEKAAVRELLDGRDAQSLAPRVSLNVTSATAGDWTYFRVRAEAKRDLKPVPKDFVILLDASGSIGWQRMISCREAAARILRRAANTEDRFNLVAFRDRFSYAFPSWCACHEANFKAAEKWLNELSAFGRTDVFGTISSLLALPRDPKRPLIALVVTDGEVTSGLSDTAKILSRFTALNDGLISVYMYGVKFEANRELIDVLTHGNRGESLIFEGYSRASSGEGMSVISERFRDPVLTDLRLVFATGCEAESYPRLLRNLYRGVPVEFTGRIKSPGRRLAFSLKGLAGQQAYEDFFEIDLAQATFDSKLPRLWQDERALDAAVYAEP